MIAASGVDQLRRENTNAMNHRRVALIPQGSATLLVISLALAACSGSTTSPAPSVAPTAAPTATPAATPTPTPAPTPADVSAAFVRRIASPDFKAAAVISGKITVGAVSGEIAGTGAFSGPDSKTDLTITAGTFKEETLSTHVGTSSWSKRSPGPWLEDPAKAAGSTDTSIGEILKSILSLTDLGVETHAGKELHHLRSTNGNAIPPAVFGVDASVARDAAFTLDFYATDDGTPAVMAVAGTWTQSNNGEPVATSMSFDIVLEGIGSPQTIEPPTDVWVRYNSKAYGYTMAHPADWTVKPAKDKDSYLLNGHPYVYVGRTAYKGTTAEFAAALKKSYRKDLGGDPTSEAATRLGGEAAVRLTYATKNASRQDVTVADDVVTHGGTGWEVFLATVSGPGDIDLFDQFSATFEFTK